MKRGDIYIADLDPAIGSEQRGKRPVVIVQNDTGNMYSPTTIVVPITSSLKKPMQPTHVNMPVSKALSMRSFALAEQITRIDKRRLLIKKGNLSKWYMDKIDEAILVAVGIGGKLS